MKRRTTVEYEYDCCGAKYTYPTAIPETGSILRHAAVIDTLTMQADTQHIAEHPECAEFKRCTAGVDNYGVCKHPNHGGWHTPEQGEHLAKMNYNYDRCRRVAYHTGNCFPDGGSMVTPEGEFIIDADWMEAWDAIVESGEGVSK